MSLLSLLQNASDRLGIVRPASVINSSDQQTARLLGYAQQEGEELAAGYPWQILSAETTFVSTATETQTNAIPDAFDRFIDDTFYNRTRKRPVWGPMNSTDWAFAKSVVSTVIIESFRQRGSSTDILITPVPVAGDTYAFEYISKNWCQSSGGTGQSSWLSDTDTGILDEKLMTLGVIWRFKAGQGFDYSEEFRTYELMKTQRQARDGGKRTLDAGRFRRNRYPAPPFIQDGSWNL